MTDDDAWDDEKDRRAQPVYQIGLKLDVLHRDVTDMKAVLKDLTTAIGKLAIVEERQAQTTLSIERVLVAIAKLDERTSALEDSLPDSKRTAVWMDRAVWAGLTAIAVFAGKHLGLL